MLSKKLEEDRLTMADQTIAQNLSVCVGLSILAGFLRVVATMVLAYPEHLDNLEQDQIHQDLLNTSMTPTTTRRRSNRSKICYIGTHIFLISAAALVSMVATFFGPVSIAVPVLMGSQLLLNVIAMGLVLKMRTFDKSQQVGTFVVFLSVLSLMDIGPDVQDGQDILLMLESTPAQLWTYAVGLSMLLSACWVIPFVIDKQRQSESGDGGTSSVGSQQQPAMVWILTIGSATSNVSMATLGKMLSLLTGGRFYFVALLCGITGILGTLMSVVSSTFCEQGLFTPLSAVALIIVNAITGVLIWEDWKVVTAWSAYVCALVLMCCGVYLIAEVDLMDILTLSSPRGGGESLSSFSMEETTPLSSSPHNNNALRNGAEMVPTSDYADQENRSERTRLRSNRR